MGGTNRHYLTSMRQVGETSPEERIDGEKGTTVGKTLVFIQKGNTKSGPVTLPSEIC